MPLASIHSLVRPELEATDQYICTELRSEIPFINQIIEYILHSGGKRIRPLLVLLTAGAFKHKKNLQIDLAAAIELIHTATLLHDDVVDDSHLRRGQETANDIWGNNASVLVGDFLYSRAFQLIVKTQNLEVINIFSNATNLIAEGEVLQLLNCHNAQTTETAYFDVIQRKTAKLFEVAAQVGTALCDYSPQQMDAMKNYGMQLGIAYQLIDDVLDYNSSAEEMGKNIGNDLSEGKPTLPLIYAMRQGKKSEIDLISHAIEQGSTENLQSIISIIESTGAIKYTARTAKDHAQKAKGSLDFIPDSPYRKALHDLTDFVVDRNY